MNLKDYLPLKAICEDLGVSRWTLWRAAASNIAGFPEPKRIGRQIFWKRNEIDALEAALIQFKGRCAFDRQRQHAKKIAALTRARAKPQAPKSRVLPAQGDLFS